MTNQTQENPHESVATSKTGKPFTREDMKKSITEILEFVGTDGLASLENLYDKFWPGLGVQSCRRFLSQLERAGWLERHFIHVRKPGQLVFTLTVRGAKDHFGQAARKNLMIGLPANGEIKQQLLAQQARLQLEKQFAAEGKRIIEWQNERQLRRETVRNIKSGISTLSTLNDIADARMTVQTQEGCVYRQEIEIDGEYYGQMLKNKIETYRQKGTPILWVTTSNRANRIKSEIARAFATNISLFVPDNY
ncbi:MAG: hypothetical protein BGO39_15595 [Chloroflexi bacterium 54-19]|nr:MAG: hypothetical protein BGO39_15595 [Chloroflexi bacterium 54-19]